MGRNPSSMHDSDVNVHCSLDLEMNTFATLNNGPDTVGTDNVFEY